MRKVALVLNKAVQCIEGNIEVAKDYQKLSELRHELSMKKEKENMYSQYPLRYQLLECKPGLPLAITKLKYLLACRRTHPEAGGDAEEFLRVSLAYQDVMKDYGVETVENQVVNLGNFQADISEAQNYLKARNKIKSYIPISTLDEHIQRIEEVKVRLGDSLSEKLAANDDDAMWLLEDIEDIMEQTGLKTVKLQISAGDKISVQPVKQLTDGTERPLFLQSNENNNSAVAYVDHDCNLECSENNKQVLLPKKQEQQQEGEAIYSDDQGVSEKIRPVEANDSVNISCNKENIDRSDSEFESNEECHNYIVEVSADDIEVLNEKNVILSRPDVAGLAANAANTLMKNTNEVRQLYLEGTVLLVLIFCMMCFVFICIERLRRIHKAEEARPEVREHLLGNTMLPWWGNDEEYEAQVKRIFLEEWRQARSTARRTQTFQDGVARESLDDEAKKRLDLQVFTVTAEKLRVMRENAQKHPGRR